MKDKNTKGNGLPHMLTDKWHGVRDYAINSNQQNRCNSHQQNTDIFHKSGYGNSHVVTGKTTNINERGAVLREDKKCFL